MIGVTKVISLTVFFAKVGLLYIVLSICSLVSRLLTGTEAATGSQFTAGR